MAKETRDSMDVEASIRTLGIKMIFGNIFASHDKLFRVLSIFKFAKIKSATNHDNIFVFCMMGMTISETAQSHANKVHQIMLCWC